MFIACHWKKRKKISRKSRRMMLRGVPLSSLDRPLTAPGCYPLKILGYIRSGKEGENPSYEKVVVKFFLLFFSHTQVQSPKRKFFFRSVLFNCSLRISQAGTGNEYLRILEFFYVAYLTFQVYKFHLPSQASSKMSTEPNYVSTNIIRPTFCFYLYQVFL